VRYVRNNLNNSNHVIQLSDQIYRIVSKGFYNVISQTKVKIPSPRRCSTLKALLNALFDLAKSEAPQLAERPLYLIIKIFLRRFKLLYKEVQTTGKCERLLATVK